MFNQHKHYLKGHNKIFKQFSQLNPFQSADYVMFMVNTLEVESETPDYLHAGRKKLGKEHATAEWAVNIEVEWKLSGY